MKRIFYCFVITVWILSGCSERRRPESIFYQDFNLVGIVESINKGELKILRNGNSLSNSNEKTTDYQRVFNLDYQIEVENDKLFNEREFLKALENEIKAKMNDSEVHINGSGSDREIHYFQYSKDRTKGRIELIGSRIGENKYKLWCILHEESR